MVADHDTRVYGDELVPVSKFHIPGLILGSDIKPRTISAISSQIDLAPTLLSLAGISAYLPMVGQDLSQPDVQPANRAMMQFGDNYGWLEQHINGPRLTVLHVDKSVKQFRYQSSSQSLAPIEGQTATGAYPQGPGFCDAAVYFISATSVLCAQAIS